MLHALHAQALIQFSMRKNDGDYDIDDEGYFVDLAGNRIEYEEGKFLPAHYGRRCFGLFSY